MNPVNHIFQWPELPPLPAPREPVLIRIVTPASRLASRQTLRAALRKVLSAWSGMAPERLPLMETFRGPQWQGPLAGCSLDISFSYCDGEGWIALVRDGVIGVDAMPVQAIAEAEMVARHYFSPVIAAGVRAARDPARAFALAWTELEARFKCLKLGLAEWDSSRPVPDIPIWTFSSGSVVVAVVTGS
jgi:phosphopantetheinyl transferase